MTTFLKARMALHISTAAVILTACANIDTGQTPPQQSTPSQSTKISTQIPANQFDLSHWKLTLPTDEDRNGKVDNISVEELQSYIHSDFFYIDEKGHMVFTAPNKGGTTQNSFNTRSELRYMIRGSNQKVKTASPLNNFALASHPNADEFASIGGRMLATLHVDHTPLNANRPNDRSAYAGVIGQIHSVKLKKPGVDFGHGAEPLKIIYKKWPHHETGSVYWHYERNYPSGHPNKRDIPHLIWGELPTNSANPGEKGIKLGEDFSYIVNVYEDTMYLTFISPRLGRVTHEVNLANNVDLNGKVDSKDNPIGYTKDFHYFKAGVYNQCRAATRNAETEGRCQGTGDWATDKANGDYFQASFSKLNVTQPIKP